MKKLIIAIIAVGCLTSFDALSAQSISCSCIVVENGVAVTKRWSCRFVREGSAVYDATGCQKYNPENEFNIPCPVNGLNGHPDECCSDAEG